MGISGYSGIDGSSGFSGYSGVIPTKFKGTSSFDFGIILPGSSLTTTISVIGATVGDIVQLGIDQPDPSLIYQGYVSATDVVSVVAINFTSISVDPATTTFNCVVFSYSAW